MIILGSGPNRIGQGIEFDYSCVHASLALAEAGYETIMVNCNPETVSTDYDTSDRLYFEPLTLEDVLEIVHAEQQAGPVAGVICQLGGQTPLGLAQGLADAGVPIVGTTPEAIHLAEERGAFGRVLAEAGLPAPKHGMASSFDEAQAIAHTIGYPVLVRPSYVLGGRGMEIVYDDETLEGYIARATAISPEHPVLVDRFIDDAVEIDVDALYDGEQLYLGGVMEHIEEAGIHSGDSSCALPPITLGDSEIRRIREATEAIARGVGRARPDQHPVRARLRRALRAGGQPARVEDGAVRLEGDRGPAREGGGAGDAGGVDRVAAPGRGAGRRGRRRRPAAGRSDRGQGGGDAVQPLQDPRRADGRHGARARDALHRRGDGLRRRLRSRVRQVAGRGLRSAAHRRGRVFASMANRDKRTMIFPIKRLADLGFEILATQGTAEVLRRNGIDARIVRKHYEGTGPAGEPTTVQLIADGEIDLIINTPHGAGGGSARTDGYEIRTAAVLANVPCITTVQGLGAAVHGIEAMRAGEIEVCSLQEWATR